MEESELFSYLKEHFIKDLERDMQQFTCFDCRSKELKVVIELKCRRKHYDELMIEKEKYDSLIKKAASVLFTPVYVNSTPQGVWGFNLLGLKLDWKKHFLPRHTDFAQRGQVFKIVGYVPVSQGKNLTKPEYINQVKL